LNLSRKSRTSSVICLGSNSIILRFFCAS
jgi:hypothetical protein